MLTIRPLQVGSDSVSKPHGSSEKAEEWQRESKALASTLRTKSGVEIGPSKVLLHVLPVEGLVRQLDNSIEKQLAQKPLLHPLQVCNSYFAIEFRARQP